MDVSAAVCALVTKINVHMSGLCLDFFLFLGLPIQYKEGAISIFSKNEQNASPILDPPSTISIFW